MPTQNKVTTVILAGGLGTRIGGDKGLQQLHGRALISWVLEAVRRDSDVVLINANAAQGNYANFGYRVIADQLPDWPGPLAGLHAALSCATTNYVMTVACDTPFLPDELLSQLMHDLRLNKSDAAVAVAGGHRQPATALYHRSVLPGLIAYLDAGGRKVSAWQDTLCLCEVIFDNAAAFENINTHDDLVRAAHIPEKTRHIKGSVGQNNSSEKV